MNPFSEDKAEKQKRRILTVFLPLALLLFFLLDISKGSVSIPFSEVLNILFANTEAVPSSSVTIVLDYRLPKALTAVLVGAGLSLSGLQMQTFFQNPLAGPYVLGISAGASLGVALWILGQGILPFPVGSIFSETAIVLSAVSGSLLIFLMIFWVSIRVRHGVTLLIVGLMFGSASGALVSILQYFSGAEELKAFTMWSLGSLAGVTWGKMPVFAGTVLVGIGLGIPSLKALDALLIGETYAQSMGVSMKKARLLIIGSASLCTAVITAFCGPIGFIGIAVPHLARLLFGTAIHRKLMPAVIALGALLMLTCDLIAHLPGSEKTLPINAVTAFLGSPLVILIILRKGRL